MQRLRLFFFLTGNVEEVRVLFYHIVVCGYMNSLSFLVPVISVWPEAFRRENGKYGKSSTVKFLGFGTLENFAVIINILELEKRIVL